MTSTRLTLGTRCTWGFCGCHISPQQPRESPNKKFVSIFPDTHENSWRWHRHGLPWAPAAPGTLADVIFDLCSLENPLVKSIDRFFSVLIKTLEDDIDTGYPGHQVHLGMLRVSYSYSATSKTSPSGVYQSYLHHFLPPFIYNFKK